jgi:REP element-mobilizing transposase RayT
MKPGVYTQLYIHIIIAVKNRERILQKNVKKDVCKYINGILTEFGHKPIIVNGAYDHLHIFFGLNPNISISDTVHDIKRSSSLFVNSNNYFKGKFYWQEGYAAFSYSKSHVKNVYEYISNQEEHHKMKTFREEYVEFLEKYDIKYKDKYLFEFIE